MPIEDYGLIGDCHTAALVGRDGSIDWLCWPRFDSDACFAALLGTHSHGRWLIAPSGKCRETARCYRRDTLILETTFETDSGSATVIDFMLAHGATSDLVRVVRGNQGDVPMCMELVLRFGYGATTPWVSRLEDGTMRAVAGPDMVVLRTTAPLKGEDLKTTATFRVRAGETVAFIMSYGPSHLPVPEALDCAEALRNCEEFWHKWTSRTKCSGRYADAIRRSLITLKALTYAPTGGIVAAPTTSLPEREGGERNWDYRYCWIRDSTLTLLALMNAGVYDEAAAWRDWLQRAVAGSPGDMQIMYGLMGERRLTEWEVTWLPGYLDSRPVRIGNAAHRQFQLDVYGELMDTFAQARKGALAPSDAGWALQLQLVKHVGASWRMPDNGIWESRGPPRHFTYSKVMAWVTFDRAIKAVEQHGLRGDVGQWRGTREEIRDEICEHGFDPGRNTFRSAYGETTLDASLLLLVQVGFIAPDDRRYLGTVEAIERELVVDGFVRRYSTLQTSDGLEPGEGVFLACSFWLADAYVSIGRHEEGRRLFERLLDLRNDLGLLAEEYDTGKGRQLGNFPQAFSHVGLINTAFNLTRTARPAEQRAKVDGSGVQATQAPQQPGQPAATVDARRPAPSSTAR
ncbi:MAG: glycoside hydrolase family 15 protein [Reyranellaceae bacterium]